MTEKKIIKLIPIGIIALLLLGTVITVGFMLSEPSAPSQTSAEDELSTTSPDSPSTPPDESTSLPPESDNTTSADDDSTTSDVTTATPDTENTEDKPIDDNTTSSSPDVELPPLSGRIISENESNLKLIIDWSTVSRTSSEASVKFDIKLTHYTLYVGPRIGASFEINSRKFTFNTEAINQDELKKVETLLTSYTVNLPLVDGCGEFDVAASWVFNGIYGGVELSTLVIEDVITIK